MIFSFSAERALENQSTWLSSSLDVGCKQPSKVCSFGLIQTDFIPAQIAAV